MERVVLLSVFGQIFSGAMVQHQTAIKGFEHPGDVLLSSEKSLADKRAARESHESSRLSIQDMFKFHSENCSPMKGLPDSEVFFQN